jgi:hypothetical protein
MSMNSTSWHPSSQAAGPLAGTDDATGKQEYVRCCTLQLEA